MPSRRYVVSLSIRVSPSVTIASEAQHWPATIEARTVINARIAYPITGIAGCCARAASGHAAVAPTIPLMNSRRRIAFPKAQDHAKFGLQFRRSIQEIATGEIGFKEQFALQKFRAAPVEMGRCCRKSHRKISVELEFETKESGKAGS